MDETLDGIDSLTGEIETLMRERQLQISRAVAGGATWSEIAARLGCTPQSAHRRYRWLRHNETTGEVWEERPFAD